ncbi:MAG: sigma-54 dependent transcriptional regulator [Azoarcus sp.]|jgi:two-component system response regulator PilR (NtrC family)|nr:sigma-54 dependent transcriptional regulator [Azoarcus sp.]
MIAPERRGQAAATAVLIVDDEEDIRELLELSLLRMGLGADTVGSLAEARERIERVRYRLCLTDMRLPDGDGLELVEFIQHQQPALPVAVITAYGSIETAIRALKLGAFDFVTKPIELQVLRGLVLHALRLPGQVAASGAAGEGDAAVWRDLVGHTPAMVQLRGQIEKLARNQAPVFIYGESGTGKEVIARLIHRLGVRAAGPFVPVNCGAIPPELMESEFFGYLKGSFSGAVADKDGLFQAASGGTLFLDEVADLPLSMQVKLLRAIQERAVRPVGGQNEDPIDVRILSASHRDLAQLVAENRFRQDLYFRINVIALHVPPLRARLEDIPELAAHVLARLAERDGGPVRALSPEALAALAQYAFPGNVRELENLLERACALCEGEAIAADDLGLSRATISNLPLMPAPAEAGEAAVREVEVKETAARAGEADEGEVAEGEASESEAKNGLAEASGDERALILRTLDETRWNRSAAARKLGMTLRQLRYRLQKWGME